MNTNKEREASSLVIGVDFGRSNITAGLIDENARLLVKQQIATPLRTTRAVARAMMESILSLASTPERGKSAIRAVGVCVPGTIDPFTERVTISGLKGWTRLALRQMIEEGLSDSGYDIRTPADEKRARARHSNSPHPIMIINPQSACAAAAESWIGAARGKSDVVYFSIGEDIEAGILIDGQVLRGAGGQAGMAGWMALSEDFKREYESRGCLAAEATIASLTRRAIEEWSESSATMLSKLIKSDPAQLDCATIIRAARGGDGLALRVVNETCRWIGRAAANLISLLNPQTVVIGGDLGLSLKPFNDEIREEVRKWVSPEVLRQCRVVSASVGEKAGLIGAARLAWLSGENAKDAK